MLNTSISHSKHYSLQNNIEAELIKMLYQQAHTALIGVIATATAIAAIYFNEVSNLTVSIWLVTIYLLSFVRYLSIQRFKKANLQITHIIRWGWIFACFTFLSGLTWGAASIIFFTPDNLQLFNILTLIIIAMSVGSLAALSAFPNAYYLFVIPTMLPIIWRYLNIDEQNYYFFGLLLFVFIAALFAIVRVNRRILYNSIVLRFENTQLLNQLTEQKDKAEQANIAKTKFLAAASHDLRQPLHAQSLFLGLLEPQIKDHNQKNIIHKIQKSNNALGDLLEGLLDISKLDANIIQAQPSKFQLQALFNDLYNDFEAVADEKNLRLHFVKTHYTLNTDKHILDRILRNIIGNAIRYTDEGGVVIGVRKKGKKIAICVFDSGMGIPKDKQKEVFLEFQQLNNHERDRTKGFGLGLAIVQRLAQLLEAKLEMNSTEGKGTQFSLAFNPIDEMSASQPIEPKKYQTKPMTNKTILVVDDENDILTSLTAILESWGHCVIQAASGSEAIEKLHHVTSPPDIILTDYRLRDGETGADVIKAVNKKYKQNIPATIITGDTAPDRIKEAKDSGYSLLHKPLSVKKLSALVN